MQSKEKQLSVCMIVKDCEESLADTLKSIPSWVHEIVIADTGSKDNTKEVAKKFGAKVYDYVDPDPIVYEDHVWLSDFSAARNFAFEKCTGDYIFWIDSDDVFWEIKPGLFKKYFDTYTQQGDADIIAMTYDYEHDATGECTMRQVRERIVKNGDWVWRAPIHEVLCCLHGHRNRFLIPEDECRIVHIQMSDGDNKLKSMRNYLVAQKFLDDHDGVAEARLHMNLGNSLMGLGRYEEAIKHFLEYQRDSLWNMEKHSVQLSIANCYKNMGDLDRYKSELLKAVAMDADVKEGFIELASACLMMDEPKQAMIWAGMSDKAKKDHTAYRHNPKHLTTRPVEIKAIASFKLEKYEDCIKFCDEVLDHVPGNSGILGYKSLASKLLREKDAIDSFSALEKLVIQERDIDKVKKFRDALPEFIKMHPASGVRADIAKPPTKRSICFYCGEGHSNWDYTSIDSGGVGGSETAVIRMAEEFARLGWHVEVYGYPHEGNEGEHNGVHWQPYWRIPTKYKYDVLVNWRVLGALTMLPDAFVKVAWFHDVQYPDNWDRELAKNYDKFIVLSEAHRKNLNWVPDEKIFISRNGLDPSFFEGFEEEKKSPKRLVYASCPSRGLEHIMDNWDKIREAHPDCEIDVFYGFTGLYMAMMKREEKLRVIYNKARKFFRQPGVNFHGMVDQRTLGRAFARASYWAYPCHFPEISCITAMQAQVSGAYPVTTRYWALDETVKYGTKVGEVDRSITEVETFIDAWVKHLIACMDENVVMTDEQIQECREYHLWSEVAKEWNQEFTDLLTAGTRSHSSALQTTG